MYVANFADRGFIESRDKGQLEYISKAIEKAIGVNVLHGGPHEPW